MIRHGRPTAHHSVGARRASPVRTARCGNGHAPPFPGAAASALERGLPALQAGRVRHAWPLRGKRRVPTATATGDRSRSAHRPPPC